MQYSCRSKLHTAPVCLQFQHIFIFSLIGFPSSKIFTRDSFQAPCYVTNRKQLLTRSHVKIVLVCSLRVHISFHH
jgi:hypothetical protein